MSETPRPIQPLELLQRIVALFPRFEQQWQSADNCYRNDDGSFTYCGVFAEFSAFARDYADTLTSNALVGLAGVLADCMNGTSQVLDEAAATCFLENLIDEPVLDRLKPHLYGEPLGFVSQLLD